MNKVDNIEQLTIAIYQTNQFFIQKVQKQVNTALTLRNWLIGYQKLNTNNPVKTGQNMANNCLKLLLKALQPRN